MRIVKLGGSCYRNLRNILNELECVSRSTGEPICIVPGGWIFADMVRSIDLDDTCSHWLAVASMDVYGYIISSLLSSKPFYPGPISDSTMSSCHENFKQGPVINMSTLNHASLENTYPNYLSPEDFDVFIQELNGVKVILPYKLLKKYDELPHSWDVTSDSMSIWLAHRLGLNEVVKITDVDGIYIKDELVDEIFASELTGESCVDRHVPFMIQKYSISMFICNGFKSRVKDYILRGRAVGTLIKAHLNDNRI